MTPTVASAAISAPCLVVHWVNETPKPSSGTPDRVADWLEEAFRGEH